MKKKDESSGRKNPIAVLPINVHITTPEAPKAGSDGLEGSSFVKDLKEKRWAKPVVSVWIQNEAQ